MVSDTLADTWIRGFRFALESPIVGGIVAGLGAAVAFQIVDMIFRPRRDFFVSLSFARMCSL
jgi:hypothetical protein